MVHGTCISMKNAYKYYELKTICICTLNDHDQDCHQFAVCASKKIGNGLI